MSDYIIHIVIIKNNIKLSGGMCTWWNTTLLVKRLTCVLMEKEMELQIKLKETNQEVKAICQVISLTYEIWIAKENVLSRNYKTNSETLVKTKLNP